MQPVQEEAAGGGTGTIAVNNSNWFFSPYNWYVNGSTYAQTVNPGAYFKVAFSGNLLFSERRCIALVRRRFIELSKDRIFT